jgi:hypothetical protein
VMLDKGATYRAGGGPLSNRPFKVKRFQTILRL